MAKGTERDWTENELVMEHIQRAAKGVGEMAAQNFTDYATYAVGGTSFGIVKDLESPLEVIWSVWWDACSDISKTGELFALAPQRTVEVRGVTYRLDFVVVALEAESLEKQGLSWPLIGIELDGHAFHEKTLEQVTYRNQRDRQLQQNGWRVFHYSFSEMVKSPFDCVAEVMMFSSSVWHALQAEAGRRSSPKLSAEIAELLKAQTPPSE